MSSSASRSGPGYGDLWLVELEGRAISEEGTKENYRDDLRVHVRPFFENDTLGEVGRVEAFLKQQRAVSYSMAKHSRTLLNQLFGYALRPDALSRNPGRGHLSAAQAQRRAAGAHPGADHGDPARCRRLAYRAGLTGPEA